MCVFALRTRRTRTLIWDVTDLRKPELKKIHLSVLHSIDHNQYIKGNYTSQSNYDAGLRILHIDEQNYELKEVAYFDTFPTPLNGPGFRGTWSNYPYYKSGMPPPNFGEIEYYTISYYIGTILCRFDVYVGLHFCLAVNVWVTFYVIFQCFDVTNSSLSRGY